MSTGFLETNGIVFEKNRMGTKDYGDSCCLFIVIHGKKANNREWLSNKGGCLVV